MKVLVTGGTGFVGSHVVKCLRQHKHDVVIGTRGSRIVDSNVVQFLMDDLELMNNVLRKKEIECVVHLSGCASVAKSFVQPLESHKYNVQDTVNLLNLLADRYRNIKLVLASSSEVYKQCDEVLSEESLMNPVSPYGLGKMYVDCFARMIVRQSDLKWIVVRPFNTIGIGQNLSYVFPSFVKQIVEIKLGMKDKILKVGNVQISRDFTDVRDVAEAYVRICENQEESDVFNICSGVEHSLSDCINKMLSIAKLEDVEIEVDEKLLRPVDVMRFPGSNKKIFEKLGWMPKISIEQSINDLIQHVEEKIKNENRCY